MLLTATHFNYFFVCHRKLWLFTQGIHMEHTSDTVSEGKLIGQESYPYRAEKYSELVLDNIKIDFFDAKNKVVHEVKKSDKLEHAHIAQVKYYLYILRKYNIEATALLEYPKLRKTQIVLLEEGDFSKIENDLQQIYSILESPVCPNKIKKTFCKTCSYFDFCWVEE